MKPRLPRGRSVAGCSSFRSSSPFSRLSRPRRPAWQAFVVVSARSESVSICANLWITGCSIQIQSGVAALRAFPPHSKGDPPGHRPGLQYPIREIRVLRSFGCWAVGLFPAYPLCSSVVKGLFRLFDLPHPAGAATTKNPAGGTRPGAFALGERSGTTAAQHHRQRAQAQQAHRRRLRDRNRGPVRSEAIRPHHRRIITKKFCGVAVPPAKEVSSASR